MVVFLLILAILTFVLLRLSPVQCWILKEKAKYRGKKIRLKIQLIKYFEPVINWLNS